MLDQTSYQVASWINRNIWRPLNRISRTVPWLPLSAGIALATLFALSGQYYEIAGSDLEADLGMPQSWALIVRAACAAGAFTVLSMALFFANYAMSDPRNDIVYGGQFNVDTDRRVRSLRAFVGWAAAFLPWLGVAIGLWRAHTTANENAQKLSEVRESLPAAAAIYGNIANPLQLASRELAAVFVVAALGVAVSLVLHLLRRHKGVRSAALSIVVALFALLLLLPWLFEPSFSPGNAADARIDVVALLRAIGPLAMSALVGAALFSILAVISILSRQIGFPLVPITLVATLIIVLFQWPLVWFAAAAAVACFVICCLGAVSRKWALAGASFLLVLLFGNTVRHQLNPASQSQSPQSQPVAGLQARLEEWIAAREKLGLLKRFADAGRDYPLLIIAAEGGGIYATAATSTILSRLQDACGSFAQHVFAISGVSGGGVGASIFQSLVRDRPLQTTGCSVDPKQSVSQIAADVVADDHLSTLLGLILPDIVLSTLDRAVGLELSLQRSYLAHTGKDNLGAPFESHWNPATAAPALVLNTTWVETGFRVAFAPFTLNGGSDGTLYAFGDSKLSHQPPNLSVAKAAVVSARFPGAVPAYSFNHPSPKDPTKPNDWKKPRLWSFVDGGYSDGSGSATALVLYNQLTVALNRINSGRPADNQVKLDLRVILLGSLRPNTDIAAISGNLSRDMLAPIVTLLGVRGLLYQQAIIRTFAEINTREHPKEEPNAVNLRARTGNPDGWHVASIELDTESVKLALGWKISRTTQSLISLLIGDGQLCSGKPANVDPVTDSPNSQTPTISAANIEGNSCVQWAIIRLLDVK